MEEKKYVDLLIVKSGEDLHVAEAESSWIHTGDMVEIGPLPTGTVIGEVIDDAIFDEVGGERYRWITKLHPIWPVIRHWHLTKDFPNN